ncbi:amidohydrolase [Flavobacterium sp. 14A]|uniref:amidohydrolase n=1 Tax=Flavobacterium sp. 14A TaxID=2735896 RepID=UPI001570D340|nr:amidohydrolase [Flavobacterium sp. 14A]NRT12440.1 amidohydrolase [Flavobacterium sp. 14A]
MNLVGSHSDLLTTLRQDLHQYPEVSGQEEATAKKIALFLSNYPPDALISNLGGHGIIAIYNGEKDGKQILFRCELDALPIAEINNFKYRSKNEAVSHKCGHDGHMAILCGLAMQLHEKRPETGSVALLFQPAEEDGSGAAKVFNDSKFTLQPDYAFALHNLPGYTLHDVVIKNDTFSCAVNSMIIKLKGKTAHAGEPHMGINPTLAVAAIITAFNESIHTDVTSSNYGLITPIYTNIGSKAYGVSAGEGQIHFTVRSNSNAQMKKLEAQLKHTATTIALEHQLEITISWTESFQANENNHEAANYIRQAAASNQFTIQEKESPFSWGEDFGLFTQQFPGAMFGLGSGVNTPALHNPDYDFPDEIISTGVTIFHSISKQILNAH